MDIDQLIQLIVLHKWIPLAAVVVGALIRLLKEDLPGPSIPSRYRPIVALVLGVLFGFLNKLASGGTMGEAIAGGVAVGMLAITGHDVGIEGLRNGKELFERRAPVPPPPEPPKVA